MKINRAQLPVFVDHWGSVAISAGAGYVILSPLKSEIATPVAWILLTLGFVVRLAMKYRRKRSEGGKSCGTFSN